MEQGLNLKLQQKLAMTQQLRQAIEILQLSAQELSDLIESEFLENPAVEFEEEYEDNSENETTYSFEEIKALAKYLDDDTSYSNAMINPDREEVNFESKSSLKPSLLETLELQVELSFVDPLQRKIAQYMIGCIDDNGYLKNPVEEFAAIFHQKRSYIEEVLEVIQTFEPDGVGARSLKECLTIQAKQQDLYHGIVQLLIDSYLSELGQQNYKAIAKQIHFSPSEVQQAAKIIQKFNPKPGLQFGSDQAEYITPDVIVRKINDEYVVIINDYGLAKLRISKSYENIADLDSETKKYIEGRVNAATWLMRSIEQRRNTLYRVMTAIVEQQKEFFDKGQKFMRPLLMKTIAEELEIHESTVSRTVANKYAQTPYGLIRLKNFFQANLGIHQEELIAGQIKDVMRDFIEHEDKKNPLSDQQICELLKEKDMKISRRTVMKYREQMGYPSSMKRKKY